VYTQREREREREEKSDGTTPKKKEMTLFGRVILLVAAPHNHNTTTHSPFLLFSLSHQLAHSLNSIPVVAKQSTTLADARVITLAPFPSEKFSSLPFERTKNIWFHISKD